MNLVEITSLDDPRLDAYLRLTEAQLRNRLEPERGLFIAESPKVISRALDAGMQAVSFLMERKHLETAAPLIEAAEATAGAPLCVFTGQSEILCELTGFELTRGVLCAMRRPTLPDAGELLARSSRVAVLEGIVDHTNVGAIFRSAAALGLDAVLLSPSCCDPLYRRAARVSMGAVFQVPWTRLGQNVAEWPNAGLATLREHGFTCAALALAKDALSIDDPALSEASKLALFLGTEGDGLDPRTIASCDVVATIPMCNGVDSLNVAAAAAVAFWQLRPNKTRVTLGPRPKGQ